MMNAYGRPCGYVRAALMCAVLCAPLSACNQPVERGSELSQLRDEVAALRREVAALRGRLDGPDGRPGDESAISRDGGVSRNLAPVTWTFQVTPVGAQVTVDGKRVQGGRFRGPRTDHWATVVVSRAGHRTVQQAVKLDRDHTLRYRLVPGRGIQRLPPPRN